MRVEFAGNDELWTEEHSCQLGQKQIYEVFVDRSYRGHGECLSRNYISAQKRGITKRRLERRFKRQQAVELVITPPFQVLNLGAGNFGPLRVLISLIEEHRGIETTKNYVAGPRGEALETLVDIEFTENRTGFYLQFH